MNQTNTPIQSAANGSVASDFAMIDVMIAIAKRKKLIVVLPLAAAALAAAVSLMQPNVYRASTKLLPPQQAQSGSATLLSQLVGMAGAVAGGAGLKSPNDLYIGMLKSRRIADKVIAKFDLKKVYDTDSMEKARKALEDRSIITAGKDGLITIEVDDESQKLVAQIANAYVDELLQLTKVLAVTEAAQRRVFFERQLELSKNNLAAAELKLKGSLDSRGVISVDSDSSAILETVGRLRAQISAKKNQLSSMGAFVTVSNPEFRRVQEELQDVKYHQMLYELLAKQYAVARLDEAKDPPIIQVLDRADEPEGKFKPKRAIIVLLAGLFGLVAAISWAFLAEVKERSLSSANGSAQWAQFRTLLRGK